MKALRAECTKSATLPRGRRACLARAYAPTGPQGPSPLFLLQWHRGVASSKDAVKQLKALEKVSKDALWYSVNESEAGDHVLLVTSDVKAAKKYKLQELPAGDEPIPVVLEGLPQPVHVPVPAIRAALHERLLAEAEGEDSSSCSDSDEDEGMPEKAGKATQILPVLPETVEENPLAAQQAAALLAGTQAPVAAGDDRRQQKAAVGSAGAEAVLGLLAKQQRRKLKACVQDVNSPAAQGDCMNETSSSSESEDEASTRS